MPAGLEDWADGKTVCSRSGVWPTAWPCISASPSRRSERGSRGAEKSPAADSQDRSPLLAYSSSIWVVVRLRAWGSRFFNIPSATKNYSSCCSLIWNLIRETVHILFTECHIFMHSSSPYSSVWIHHIASSDLRPAYWNKIEEAQSLNPDANIRLNTGGVTKNLYSTCGSGFVAFNWT